MGGGGGWAVGMNSELSEKDDLTARRNRGRISFDGLRNYL